MKHKLYVHLCIIVIYILRNEKKRKYRWVGCDHLTWSKKKKNRNMSFQQCLVGFLKTNPNMLSISFKTPKYARFIKTNIFNCVLWGLILKVSSVIYFSKFFYQNFNLKNNQMTIVQVNPASDFSVFLKNVSSDFNLLK